MARMPVGEDQRGAVAASALFGALLLSLASVAILHDLNAAARYCDRVATLDQGRLAAVGSPSKVLTPALLGRGFGVEAIVATDSSGAVMISPVRALARPPVGGTPQDGGNGAPFARCEAA